MIFSKFCVNFQFALSPLLPAMGCNPSKGQVYTAAKSPVKGPAAPAPEPAATTVETDNPIGPVEVVFVVGGPGSGKG